MSSSTAVRVFRGCRALLAPAKSSSSTSTAGASAVKVAAAAAAPKSKAKAKPKPKTDADAIKPKRNVNMNAGIMKPRPISPALGSFLGAAESSRAEAVKQIWDHIKLNSLQVFDLYLLFASFFAFMVMIVCVHVELNPWALIFFFVFVFFFCIFDFVCGFLFLIA